MRQWGCLFLHAIKYVCLRCRWEGGGELYTRKKSRYVLVTQTDNSPLSSTFLLYAFRAPRRVRKRRLHGCLYSDAWKQQKSKPWICHYYAMPNNCKKWDFLTRNFSPESAPGRTVYRRIHRCKSIVFPKFALWDLALLPSYNTEIILE